MNYLKGAIPLKNKKKISIIAALTCFIILLIHLINKLIFFVSSLKETLYSGNSNTYHWRFGKIFYTKKGSGSPLLLIHDLDCTSSDYEWKELVNVYAEHYTVYTIDLLGCGRSEKPKLTYTNYMYVQLITDFIKNVIKQKTNIVATGKSTSIVTMACFTNSELFNNLIFINPSDISEQNKFPTNKHKLLKHLIECPIIGTSIYNIIVNKYFIKYKFSNEYFYKSNDVKRKYIEAYYEASHLSGASSKYLYSSIKSHFTNINIVHAIKEINNSIYIIGGEEANHIDKIISDYTNLNPSIEATVIPESKLLPQLEKPVEIYYLTRIYLSE